MTSQQQFQNQQAIDQYRATASDRAMVAASVAAAPKSTNRLSNSDLFSSDPKINYALSLWYKKNNISHPILNPLQSPDFHELSQQYQKVPGLFNTRQFDNAWNPQIEAVNASSGQSANNAERAYTSRASQLGIPALGAGAVGAQIRGQGALNASNLKLQGEQYKQGIRKDAASAAASIASNIGSLRDSYTKTLADYNLRQAALNTNVDQFNATQTQQQQQFYLNAQALHDKEQMDAATLAAQTGTEGRSVNGMPIDNNFFAGYIPNSGPIIPGRGYGVANGNNVFLGRPGGSIR